MYSKDDKLQMLKTLVEINCRNAIPFTSVCMSNRMKEISMWLSNRDTAEYLRENTESIAHLEGVDYNKTLISVSSGYVATLYHSKGYDPDKFTNINQKAITPDEFEEMHGIEPF